MEMFFCFDVKEVDPKSHCYGVFIKLGPTYDGIGSDEESMPKTSMLILVLGLIFMKGNCATEEEVQEAVNLIGIYSAKDYFLFGAPRELITEEFKEKYLDYQ
ncbi:Melanoma-associated antigen B16 [Heterocephalus glaber]|nr:Melanoma-associated antigen B16 [Heterocephalus glaber]